MFSNIVMKILERRPRSYDRRMNRLSRGRVHRMKRKVVSEVPVGSRVLEMGCGTGELAEMLCFHGSTVEGFDLSPAMLEVARERIVSKNLGDRLSVRVMGVEGMDQFNDESYDVVIGTLVLSELSDDERRFAMHQAVRVLKPGGRLVIADELVPRARGRRVLRKLAQAPARGVSYLVTRTAVRPLLNPAGLVTGVGLTVIKEDRSRGDSFGLLVGQKPKEAQA